MYKFQQFLRPWKYVVMDNERNLWGRFFVLNGKVLLKKKVQLVHQPLKIERIEKSDSFYWGSQTTQPSFIFCMCGIFQSPSTIIRKVLINFCFQIGVLLYQAHPVTHSLPDEILNFINLSFFWLLALKNYPFVLLSYNIQNHRNKQIVFRYAYFYSFFIFCLLIFATNIIDSPDVVYVTRRVHYTEMSS